MIDFACVSVMRIEEETVVVGLDGDESRAGDDGVRSKRGSTNL